jgi:heat shock protein HslJ
MIRVIALSAFLLQATPDQPALPPQLAPQPYEGDWRVGIIDNIRVMPDSRVTMNIRRGGISGSASCNSYRGSFTVTDDHVKVGQLLKTMKSCDGPRMSEEADFFKLLHDVVGYEVRGKDVLVLTTREGKQVSARRGRGDSQ